jgi:PD-(D/E)XK nuclease superfamily protein
VELTTDQKGAIAESKVATAAIELGIGVSRPVSPLRYDLVFDLDTRLVRVQCKWASTNGNVVVIRCRTSRRGPNGYIRTHYYAEEIDLIAAYCGDLDACYLLPVEHFDGRSAVQLRLSPAKNNQRHLVNWAVDYRLDATLERLGAVAQLGERQSGTLEVRGSIPLGSMT